MSLSHPKSSFSVSECKTKSRKKPFAAGSLAAFAVLFALGVVAAPTAAQTGNPNQIESRTVVRSDAGIAPIFPQMFEPVATAGLLDDKLIKNQPVAAVFESETVSLQPNGGSVTSLTTIKIYRDSQGRTRREQTSAENAADRTITIEDPVLGVAYLLTPATQTAFRYKLANVHPQSNGLGDAVPRVIELLRKDDPQTGTVRKYRLDAPKVEVLGRRQIVAGVEAEGRRLTFKIPAGAVGNATEVEATNEIWVAKDLRMLVKSTTRNPLAGEHNLRLTSLSRDEQPASLFEAPIGYTVRESGAVRTDLPPY